MSDPIRFSLGTAGSTRSAPQGDVGHPEWRAALLAETIRHTAHVAGPICFHALFKHLQDCLGLPEEACGGEINSTVFLLVRSGLYTSNTFDAATGDLWLRHDTQLTPARMVTVYLYGDTEGEPEGPLI